MKRILVFAILCLVSCQENNLSQFWIVNNSTKKIKVEILTQNSEKDKTDNIFGNYGVGNCQRNYPKVLTIVNSSNIIELESGKCLMIGQCEGTFNNAEELLSSYSHNFSKIIIENNKEFYLKDLEKNFIKNKNDYVFELE